MMVFAAIIAYAGILALWRYIQYIDNEYAENFAKLREEHKRGLKDLEDLLTERMQSLERRFVELERKVRPG